MGDRTKIVLIFRFKMRRSRSWQWETHQYSGGWGHPNADGSADNDQVTRNEITVRWVLDFCLGFVNCGGQVHANGNNVFGFVIIISIKVCMIMGGNVDAERPRQRKRLVKVARDFNRVEGDFVGWMWDANFSKGQGNGMRAHANGTMV